MDRFAAIDTFVAVVNAGSFSGAARQLAIGQPAVSKTIAQLERELGVQLLVRSTRGLTTTEAGQRFYEHGRRALEEAHEAELAARGSGSLLRGQLRIGAAVTFASLHVIPHLPEFLAMNPELSADVVLDDRNIDLLAEGVELVLRMGNLADSSLTARRIASAPRRVVGTPAYFERYGEPKTPADLAQHQSVVYKRSGGGTSWSFQRDSTEISVIVEGRIHVSAAEGVRAAVLADMGLAIASDWMFWPELRSGAVRPVLSEWSLPSVDLWAVFATGRKPTARARAFADFIATKIRALPETGLGTS